MNVLHVATNRSGASELRHLQKDEIEAAMGFPLEYRDVLSFPPDALAHVVVYPCIIGAPCAPCAKEGQ